MKPQFLTNILCIFGLVTLLALLAIFGARSFDQPNVGERIERGLR